MTTYDWAYLCSDPARLQLTLKYLPLEPFTGLRVMTVCYASHLDPPDRLAALEHEVRNHAPHWLRINFLDLRTLEPTCPRSLHEYFLNSKPRWSLGMKLLLPFAFDGPYLYTDDDVIVPNDPHGLLTNSWGSKGCFRFDHKKRDIQLELRRAFGMANPRDDQYLLNGSFWYDQRALDAGVWFHLHRDGWAEDLERFAEMPYLQRLTTRNLEFRCLDQRFLTCFGIKHGWDQVTIHNGFAPPKFIRPGYFKKVRFFHYKSQSKLQWMALLHEHLGIF